jgi:hypothetical protein
VKFEKSGSRASADNAVMAPLAQLATALLRWRYGTQRGLMG